MSETAVQYLGRTGGVPEEILDSSKTQAPPPHTEADEPGERIPDLGVDEYGGQPTGDQVANADINGSASDSGADGQGVATESAAPKWDDGPVNVPAQGLALNAEEQLIERGVLATEGQPNFGDEPPPGAIEKAEADFAAAVQLEERADRFTALQDILRQAEYELMKMLSADKMFIPGQHDIVSGAIRNLSLANKKLSGVVTQ